MVSIAALCTGYLALFVATDCLGQGLTYDDRCRASATARALCDAEAQLTAALRSNDTGLLAQIYAEEFILINYRGTKLGRNAVLDALRTGALRFDSLASSDLQIRIYGSTGVITGRQHQVAREPGAGEKPHPQDVRFTHIYVLTGGKWLLAASQITPVLLTK